MNARLPEPESMSNKMLIDASHREETRVVVVGGILGAVIGVLTSYLLIRTSKEAHAGPTAITTSDAFKVGITAIGLVRSIAALGERQR